jgi:O-antigen biosynthesis protein
MAADLIKVLVVGTTASDYLERIHSSDLGPTCARRFEIQSRTVDADLLAVLAAFRPQVIVSFGDSKSFPMLWKAPIDLRRRWLHFEDPSPDPGRVGIEVMRTFINNATTERFPEVPLVSVFTCTCMPGKKIRRPLESVLGQTYSNWEWVIYDDSPDDGATFNEMVALSAMDQRIHVFRADSPSGVIGEVKRRACMLARGSILVELDHDDELAPEALRFVVEAFREFPDAGFAYTDCAEVFDDGRPATYPDGWAFGFGSYRTGFHKGVPLSVTNYPGINAKTIRHIVGVPNHLRAWRREVYHQIGGHSPDLHVCDDYEIILRTFLATRMVHIRALGYIQYHNSPGEGGNTQRRRNQEIQRLVCHFRTHYEDRIHKRLVALGADDFIWRDGHLNWMAPNPSAPCHANYSFDPLASAQASSGAPTRP